MASQVWRLRVQPPCKYRAEVARKMWHYAPFRYPKIGVRTIFKYSQLIILCNACKNVSFGCSDQDHQFTHRSSKASFPKQVFLSNLCKFIWSLIDFIQNCYKLLGIPALSLAIRVSQAAEPGLSGLSSPGGSRRAQIDKYSAQINVTQKRRAT